MINRRLDLDVIRFTLSILVVLYHVNDDLKFGAISDLGGEAVIGFFVMSGYIFGCKYSEVPTVRKFMLRRLKRLYPLLLITVLTEAILKLLYGFYRDIDYYSVIDLFESLTFQNSTTVFGNSYGVNPPSWSISAEMYAYLVFAIISKYRLRKYVYLLLSVLLYLSFDNTMFIHTSRLGLIAGITCFSYGVFSAKLDKVSSIMMNLAVVLLGITLNSNELLICGTIMLIGLLDVFGGWLARYRKQCEFIGEISFPIYLGHSLVLFLSNIFPKDFGIYYALLLVTIAMYSLVLVYFDRYVQNLFHRSIS